jgi:hypothetical protein
MILQIPPLLLIPMGRDSAEAEGRQSANFAHF